MAIEERELYYSPDSPLRAWRLFRVRVLDGDAVLCSPMYRDPDPPPWPEGAFHRQGHLVLPELAGPSDLGLGSCEATMD